MKYAPVLFFLLLLACGSNRNDMMTKLMNEQKLLKDSANNINQKIGAYLHKNVDDSAEAKKKQLSAVYDRLIGIQFSLDSLDKVK